MISAKVFNSYDDYDSYMKSQISLLYEDTYEKLSENEKEIIDNTIIPSYNKFNGSICQLDFYHYDSKYLVLAFILYVLKTTNQVIYVTDTNELREYLQSQIKNEVVSIYSLEEYLCPYREQKYYPVVIFDNIDKCVIYNKICFRNKFADNSFTLVINYK